MNIELRHGSGGEETGKLIASLFAKYLTNPILDLHHAAVGLLAQFHNVLCRNSHFGILPYTVFVGL